MARWVTKPPLIAAAAGAAIDGLQNKLNPGEPLDKNIYDLEPEELATVPTTPGEEVRVRLTETDGVDGVWLVERTKIDD